MLFRITVSLLALFTVLAGVFTEMALSYSGVSTFRDTVYNALYEAAPVGVLDSSVGDAMLTTMIYTLPECFIVLLLYHVYALIGRSMGLGPTEPMPSD